MSTSCTFTSDLSNGTLQALACASDDESAPCLAICPNPDISGIGVRSAFYIQSVMNALLVVFSRRDSVTSTWAATLLTGSLVIAAMVQKKNDAITLHHAILTMNFATLSCISSLAVAPTLPIWRLTPREYYAKRLARDVLGHDGDEDAEHQDRLVGTAVDAIAGRHKKKIERAQNRQRLFLAIALLTQVVLQWAWGVTLFVSWNYSQKNCSSCTRVVFFLATFVARDINRERGHFAAWVLWLLFSLGVTMAMTIVLALTSPSRARAWTIRSSPVLSRITTSSSTSPARSLYDYVYRSAIENLPSWSDRPAQLIFGYNILSIFLWLVYLISSELQIQANHVFEGDNAFNGFGQITAFLLSLAPLWSLIVALYKWPATRRKQERRRRRLAASQRASLQASTQHSSAHSLSSASASSSSLPALASVHVHVLQTGGSHHDNDGDDDRRRLSHGAVAVPALDPAVPLSASSPPRPSSHGNVPARTLLRSRASNPRRQHAQSRSGGPVQGTTPPSSSFSLSDVLVPHSTAEEWNELVSFSPASRRSP